MLADMAAVEAAGAVLKDRDGMGCGLAVQAVAGALEVRMEGASAALANLGLAPKAPWKSTKVEHPRDLKKSGINPVSLRTGLTL